MSIKKPIRVGFDMDGVLLYNPARIVRPLVSLLKKKKIIHRKELQFFVPETIWQKTFWKFFHKSSLFISPGIKQIEQLVRDGEIEAYVVTGRFGHLEKDTKKWFKKFNKNNIFKQCFMNEKDEQPHLFKKRKIKELKLDYFVEDNWDIVQYLNTTFNSDKPKLKIVWISNFFDFKKEYKNKFLSLTNVFKDLFKVKKNLLFFSPYFYPHRSGITKYSHKILESLTDDYEITVLTFRFSKKLAKRKLFQKLNIIRMPFLFSLKKGFISFSSIFYFFKYVFRNEIVFIDYPNVEGSPLILISSLLKKKIITAFHCKIEFSKGLFQSLLKLILDFSALVHLKFSKYIIVLSNDYFLQFEEYKKYLYKVKEIFPSFVLEKKDDQFFNKLIEKKGKNIWLGFIGRTSSEKGIETLLDALTKLPKNHYLVIASPKNTVGEKKYINKINKLLKNQKERILFFNDLSDKKLMSLFSAIDLLILPSEKHTEAFGIVQLEAMKVGTPVVSTNIPGVRVPIKKTGLGSSFKIRSAKSLEKNIIKTLKNKNLKNRKKNIEVVNNVFSEKKVISQYKKLLSL